LFSRFRKLVSKKIPNSLLDPYYLSSDHPETLKKQLDVLRKRLPQKSRSDLFLIIRTLMKKNFLVSGLLKLLYIFCQYIIFLFLDLLTDTLKEYQYGGTDRDSIRTRTIVYISLMILLLVSNGFFLNRYTWYRERCENRLMTVLQILIYEKLMKVFP
jgi:hypothetical protein